MGSDFDDDLDDLLADMTNGDKKRTIQPQAKAPNQSEKPLTEGGSNVARDARKDDDSGDFLSSLLGEKTSLRKETKTESATKDPLSDIFEKGAWKQALRQTTVAKEEGEETTGTSAPDVASEISEAGRDGTRRGDRRGVRFSDEPTAGLTEAKSASKLDEWLREESLESGKGQREDGASRTKQIREIEKGGSDDPTTPRRRGVVDLSFLNADTEETSGSRKESSPTKPVGSRRGKGADWLGLSVESEDKEESPAISRPHTAPEMEWSASGSEKSVREGRRRGVLDPPAISNGPEDVGFGGERQTREREPEKKSPEKIPPWLAGRSREGTRDAGFGSRAEKRRAESPVGETKFEPRAMQGTDVRKESSSAAIAENAAQAQLKLEIADLSNRLQLAEQERDLLRRQVETLSEMHRMELQSCEEAHRKLQKTIETQLMEQHEKSRKYYESTVRRLEAKLAEADLERARLEGETSEKMDRLRQQCREEVASLQEAHGLALAKLRRDHEEEVSRLRRMKSQETEAVCGTLDRSRSLQRLTEQLGQQHDEMERLRRKLEENAESDFAARRDALEDEERRLRGVEAALRREREENAAELRQARLLVAYFQRLNERQTQFMEEEKLKLKQELAKLRAYKRVQDDRAAVFEDGLQRQRAFLENVKNNLLREQQSLAARIADSLREVAREKTDARTTFAVGRAEEEARAARLEKRRREIEAAELELDKKRRDVETRILSATELWEKCERRQKFLANWESQLQARENALFKEKTSLAQRRRDTESRRISRIADETAAKSTAIVNPTSALWRRKGEEDEAYLRQASSFLEGLKTRRQETIF